MMAFSAGGWSAATCSELNPLYEVPYMPTEPFDHSCSASHAMTISQSSHSRCVYSSGASPPDEPVPRTSARQTASPPSSHSRR